ncbi:hypothetical protein TREMEDRAFT_73290 [Tremella mesenterica DSM 1558]|uniref:uncharacterized protein n=1 Tax=Tremella mesenterica (strain ATCC 24925 / CBS 8224 / DSM 1558 / NBRC 9311 / NRRL Y-6157 / RJB 2259-6 / UBC 559-6) TaxID=578456 RepID=UPI0003F4921E|nr:uncharacterized protein TREMEDRAFT_73290 [Tremella mesenterica DSM 1558]EIW71393.1 hypothetical protein TREMEDRAFT_73290 [Tremella mesenterica DSM 1558]
MHSPTKQSGWPGQMEPPSTVERRRKGRNADVIIPLPTPPRSRQAIHPPTPDTVRHVRTSLKPSTKDQTSSMLPTPQTLPRQGRKQRLQEDSHPAEEEESDVPSPTGHTTFFLSSSSTTNQEHVIRRRPGLTFNQQMGLINPQSHSSSSNAFGARIGPGVGMGGSRAVGHRKIGQIISSESPDVEENPFLSSNSTRPGVTFGLASPGPVTSHVPRSDLNEEDAEMRSPSSSPLRQKRKSHSFSLGASALLSPPPTQKTIRLKPFVSSREEIERRRREERKRMMDEDENPFLAKPGEIIQPRRSITDETSPTVTYVFRGTKKVFANPFFSSDSRYPPAELDSDHPEYDPHPCPAPKLLWPSKSNQTDPPSSPPSEIMRTPVAPRRGRDVQVRNHEEAEEESEEDEELPVKRGMLFASGAGTKRSLEMEHEQGKGNKRSRGLKRL